MRYRAITVTKATVGEGERMGGPGSTGGETVDREVFIVGYRIGSLAGWAQAQQPQIGARTRDDLASGAVY